MYDDNRKLGHKTPCAECPFRRDSLPGFFGGFSLESYAEPVEVGVPTSCHLKDFGAKDERTRYCAGALSTIAASRKSQWPEYREAVEEVGTRNDTFKSPEEFREYHK